MRASAGENHLTSRRFGAYRARYTPCPTIRCAYSLAMELGAAARPRPRSPRRPPPPRRPAPGLHRLRRIALVAAIIALIPVAFSFFGMMAEPSNSSLGIRTVEWLREHGAAGIVSQIESTYYSLTAPSKGGPTLRALPRVGYGAATLATTAYRPTRVPPLIHPALPGEGVWHATRPGLEANPPVLLTTLRNQPEYPRVVAGLAWIDTERTRIVLYPGRQEPAVSMPRGLMQIPRTGREKLLASFNSGFKLSDSHGGVALNGHTYAAMQNGQATLVGYASGKVDVVDWREGPVAPSTVAFA